MTRTRSLALALPLALVALPAAAAPLPYFGVGPEIRATGILSSTDLAVEFALDLLDAPATTDLPTVTPDPILSILGTFDPADPVATLDATIDVADGPGFLFSGDAVEVGWVPGRIDLRLDVDPISASFGAFGTDAFAQIRFLQVDENPFAALRAEGSYDVEVVIRDLALIPLPAGALLLATALGGLGAVARRRRGA